MAMELNIQNQGGFVDENNNNNENKQLQYNGFVLCDNKSFQEIQSSYPIFIQFIGVITRTKKKTELYNQFFCNDINIIYNHKQSFKKNDAIKVYGIKVDGNQIRAEYITTINQKQMNLYQTQLVFMKKYYEFSVEKKKEIAKKTATLKY